MEPTPLKGKVALVTGGASGIGAATVALLAAEGATVVAFDVDADGLARVVSRVAERGGVARARRVDLGESARIREAVEEVVREEGRIDILVNCAGVFGEGRSILELSEKDWDRVQAINLKAPFLLIQAVGRHMVERGGGGRIVSVSSSSAFRAPRVPANYGASKAGIGQLTRSAAADLGPYDINVNAVAPGLTATPMTTDFGDGAVLERAVADGPLANLLQRVSQPEDVAATILFLCLPASRQITGQTIHTSAGAVTL
jgi:NAD(P)-dependent dehydrogenase (short-subunit alcohol dehydrogenase family)